MLVPEIKFWGELSHPHVEPSTVFFGMLHSFHFNTVKQLQGLLE